MTTTSTDTPASLVAEFQEAFNAKDKDLYYKLCMEEANEVLEAVEHLLKELVDLGYVIVGYQNLGGISDMLLANPNIGTAIQWFMQIADDPNVRSTYDEAFRRVHESNMSKLDDDGKPIRREDGKVLKSHNYKPPVLTDLVRG